MNKLWQHENVLNGNVSEQGLQPRPLYVSRSLGTELKARDAHERWSSEGPVQLCGWRRPKKITFLLTLPPCWQPAGLPSSSASFQGLASRGEVEEDEYEDEGDFSEDYSEDEDNDSSSSSLDDAPSPWNKLDDSDGGAGVKHDRGFSDSSPAVTSFRKSSLSKSPLSPFAQPARNDRVVVDMETVGIGAEELPDSSDFEDKAAEFDGQEVSTMSTDTEYGESSGWHSADLHADLAIAIADLLPQTDLVLR